MPSEEDLELSEPRFCADRELISCGDFRWHFRRPGLDVISGPEKIVSNVSGLRRAKTGSEDMTIFGIFSNSTSSAGVAFEFAMNQAIAWPNPRPLRLSEEVTGLERSYACLGRRSFWRIGDRVIPEAAECYPGQMRRRPAFRLEYPTRARAARAGFNGSTAELLDRLNAIAGDRDRRSARWPKAPNALGNSLRRMAGNLRSAGIEIKFSRADRLGRNMVSVHSGVNDSEKIVSTVSDRKSL